MTSRTILVLIALSLAGAQQSSWRIDEAPAPLRPVIARADLIIGALNDTFLRELDDGFARGGADVAIRSCHIDTTLTTHLLHRENITAGRTSDRLRSPANRAPKWAEPFVTTWAGRPWAEVPGFAVDLGQRIGVLRPMAEREICANCHGATDRMSPRVRAILADVYPKDRAVGFREGEIRGWFWVEMPKPRAQ